MITCYVLSFFTFLLLLIGFVQSFTHFIFLESNHVTFMIFTSIVYFATETLVIFFFVGTGVSIKEYTQDHKLDETFRKRSLAIKRKIYPPLMMNMLYMSIMFVLVGAVDTFRIPAWTYYLIFFACILHYLKIKKIQNDCFRDNTQVILDMSGIDKQVA